MKRFACLLLTLLLALLPLAARADVIWEPYDNDFYTQHRDECTYDDHRYTALVDAKGYKSPESNRVTDTIKAGNSAWLTYLYTDKNGVEWGIADNEKESWFRLSDFTPIYNNSDFCRDHADEISDYDGGMKDYQIQNQLILWSYPNSVEKAGAIAADEQTKGYYTDEIYTGQYTDADGRLWVSIGYYMGYRGDWVCTNDPENEALAPVSTPSQKPEATAEPTAVPTEIPADVALSEVPMQDQAIWWIVGAVLLVVTFSALMIAILVAANKKKNKQKGA